MNDPHRELDANRAHRAMLASLRHELRTPLNAIIGYSEMLLEDAEEQGSSACVPDLLKIQAAGRQLLEQVNRILDPAAVEAGALDTDLAAVEAGLRHELLTPVTAAIGYAEMLLEDARGCSAATHMAADLEKILAAARRFLALIGNIVSFPRTRAAEMDGDGDAAAAMVREVVNAVRPLAGEAPGPATGGRGKLLVVDDNALNRDLLARHLEREGHTVALAEDGRRALAMIGAEPFDLVLLDLIMPEINGYEVLQHLKGDAARRDLPVIIISALDELDSVVRCLEAGAEDYLPKPFNPVLLRARIGASLEKKRLRDIEQRYLRSLQRELEIGRQIQAGFLPRVVPQPPGWEVAAFFRPAREVAGDFYDVFGLDDGRLALLIGDVTDKGVGSALYMALFRSLLRAAMMAELLAAPAEREALSLPIAERLKRAVTMVNNYICTVHPNPLFATLFFGVLDPDTGELVYVNAGHEPPSLLRVGGSREGLPRSGPLVGAFRGAPYRTAATRLAPGDRLVLYSDGIPDARNSSGEVFGEERWQQLLGQPLSADDQTLRHLVGSIQAFIGDSAPFDDISLLVVRRL